ncbi:MAG TPA: hypothetical protein VNX01_09655 [Bacteroidia bacterium]|nr:hypothetical protein [Bacteroidia bacterium]
MINIDWLELEIKASDAESLCDNNCFSISTSYKPKDFIGFNKCNEIKYKNQSFAKLYSIPSSKLRYKDRNIQLLRLANESLYRKGVIEKEIPEFLDTFLFEPVGLKEMHIAIDSPGLIRKHNTLFNNTSLKRKRALKMSNFLDDSTKDITGVTLGSRSSDKFISLYNKSNELEKSHKEYIREYWVNNGLTECSEPIDRIELRLKRPELKGLELNIKSLNDPNYLLTLFKQKTESYLAFINDTTKEKFEVIDWEQFKLIEIKKETKVKYKASTQGIKITIKNLFLKHINCNSSIALELAKEYAKEYCLIGWYHSRQQRWLRENPVFISLQK